MKCIDTIEGTVKCILNRLHSVWVEDRLDDSEYIRNVKAVIDATDQYIHNNPEVIEDPQMLKHVLYVYSRNLWLIGHQAVGAKPAGKIKRVCAENGEYQTYYFDYLYNQGSYPR